MTNVSIGMRVRHVVHTMRAPARSMPCFSESSPTMKPGSSANETSGRWNRSHSCIRRMTFSPAATLVEPPAARGLLIMIPTGKPSTRARPVIRGLP